ncbi:MAG: histidine--tRNA ligase [Nitrospirae bacterium]|nr:MAG: histidine--tRNA ligase [Nitrospirota bacterium]
MFSRMKGVKDILPDQIPVWSFVEKTAHEIARCYGFREIRIPFFEQTDLYVRGIGGTTDIVEKEMYTFLDRDGTSLTLRPEGTAGVVRAYIEHHLSQTPTARKLYYIGPMFRHERPQSGRFRQFHQFGVEAIGSTHPESDVEVITLLWRFFSSLSLPALRLEINSLGYHSEREQYKKTLLRFLQTVFSSLCQNCHRRMHTNPLRVLDCKVPSCRLATENAPQLLDYQPSSIHYFQQVLTGLDQLGIPYHINPRLVRGLDYYCLTTFEVLCGELGAQNAIGAGGRYDGLFETLGGPPTPAVGFAVGLERIIAVLPPSLIPSPPPLVFVAGFGENGKIAGRHLLEVLRSFGISADTDYQASSLKALLRSAHRYGASHTIILGDDEYQQKHVIIRDMQSKQQFITPIDSVIQALQPLLPKRGEPV